MLVCVVGSMIAVMMSRPGVMQKRLSLPQLLMLFLYKNKYGLKVEGAFVKCYTPDRKRLKRAANLRLARLKSEQQSIHGLGICPRTDIIPLTSIIGPCFLQPDLAPTGRDKTERFYYNHWVGNS